MPTLSSIPSKKIFCNGDKNGREASALKPSWNVRGLRKDVSAAYLLVAKGGTICTVSMFKGLNLDYPMALNFKEPRLTWSYSNTHEENRQCLAWMAEGKIDGRDMITDLICLAELPQVYREIIPPGKAIKVMVKIGEEF